MAELTLNDLQDHEREAAGQAAAEFRYLKEVIKDILGAEISLRKKPENAVADLQRAETIIRRSEGRTERYLGRAGDRVLGDIHTLKKILPAKLVQTLAASERELDVEFNFFKKDLSRVTGDIVKRVRAVRELLSRVKEQKDERARAALEQQALQQMQQLVKQAQDTAKWIQAFEASSRKYEDLLQYLKGL